MLKIHVVTLIKKYTPKEAYQLNHFLKENFKYGSLKLILSGGYKNNNKRASYIYFFNHITIS